VRPRPRRRLAIAFALLAAAGCVPKFGAETVDRDVAITAHPLARFGADGRTRFGRFEFLSGLELVSADPRFGGLSALRLDDLGVSLVAVTDQGEYLTAMLLRSGDRIAGIAEARMGPLRDEAGAPLARAQDFDAEGLAITPSGAFVSFEVTNRIRRYAAGLREATPGDGPIDAPAELAALPSNTGVEALCAFPEASPYAGALLAIAERNEDGPGTPAFILTGGGGARFFLERGTRRHRPTDCAFLPDGDLLVLERAQSVWTGIDIRVRLVPAASLAPGGVADGEVVFHASAGDGVDNMEAIDVGRSPLGETIVTLASDNNFSLAQRTLLLQFRLADADGPIGASSPSAERIAP
jgi:hypothetical protein